MDSATPGRWQGLNTLPSPDGGHYKKYYYMTMTQSKHVTGAGPHWPAHASTSTSTVCYQIWLFQLFPSYACFLTNIVLFCGGVPSTITHKNVTLRNQNALLVCSLCEDSRLFLRAPFTATTDPFTTKNRYNLPTAASITAKLSASVWLEAVSWA